MRAVTYHEYGGPEVLRLADLPEPTPAASEVLLRVEAVGLNASDYEFLTARPAYVRAWGWARPRHPVLGSDVAGRVVAVGPEVTRLRVGDEVFGDGFGHWGGLAEYACLPESVLVPKPAALSFAQAAALPQGGAVALQALRFRRPMATGERVLINGAGGSAGTLALQFARHFGAGEVTAVDHGAKADLLRSLGADRVIDYRADDFTRVAARYDRIVDLVGSRPLADCHHALARGGVYGLVGGSIPRILAAALLGPVMSVLDDRELGVVAVRQSTDELAMLAALCVSGTLRPVLDREYPLAKTPEAFRRLGAGRARGKIVVRP
jgi:NADPH:quinone reductase-like Zn-dependent oxidoreductase